MTGTDDVTARLDAIEQLANAATPGPWNVDGPHWWDGDSPARVVTDHNRDPIALQPPPARWSWGRRPDDPGHNDDIAFIAASRTAVPWLVEQLREARATIAALRTQLDEALDEDNSAAWLDERLESAEWKLARVREQIDPDQLEGHAKWIDILHPGSFGAKARDDLRRWAGIIRTLDGGDNDD